MGLDALRGREAVGHLLSGALDDLLSGEMTWLGHVEGAWRLQKEGDWVTGCWRCDEWGRRHERRWLFEIKECVLGK
jgi:hypothetical protein